MSFSKNIIILILALFQSGFISAQHTRLYKSEDFHFHFNSTSVEQIKELDSTLATELIELQKRVNYYTNNPLEILLFDSLIRSTTSVSDYMPQLTDGQVKLNREKVVLNLNNSLPTIISEFRLQVIKILVDEMMFGGSFQDRIKSANVINLPDWVLPGLYHYVAYEWDVKTDNKMRYLQENYDLTRFNAIPSEYNTIKGASFWKYIEFTYGDFAIPNLLYMARRSPKFNGAVYFAFQVSILEVYRGWEKYFRLAYESDQNRTNPINGMRLKLDELVDLYFINPEKLITLERTYTGYKLYRTDIQSNRKTKLYSLRLDESVLKPFTGSISAVGDTVVLITHLTDRTKFTLVADDEISHFFIDEIVNRVLGRDTQLYYSVSKYDSSSLYHLYEGEIFRIPGFINSFDILEQKVAYISETVKGCEIWNYDRQEAEFKKLLRSKTGLKQLIFGDSNHLLFNANESGIWNGKILALESQEIESVTNYSSNILYHQYSDSLFIEYLDQLSESSLYQSEPLSIADFYVYDTIYPTVFRQFKEQQEEIESKPEITYLDTSSTYSFQSPIHPDYDFTMDNYDSLLAEGEDYFVEDISNSDFLVYSPSSAYLALTNKPLVTSNTVYLANVPLLTPNRLNISLGGSITDTYKKNALSIGMLGLLQAGARDLEFQYVRSGKKTLTIKYLNRRRILFRQDIRDGFRTNFVQATIKRPLTQKVDMENGISLRNERYDPFIFSEESFLVTSAQQWVSSWESVLSYKHKSVKNSIDMSVRLQPMFLPQNRTYNVSAALSAGYSVRLSSKIIYLTNLNFGTSQGSSPVFFSIGGNSNDLLAEFEDRAFSDNWTPALYENIFGVRGFGVNYRNGNTYITHSSQVGIQLLDYLFARPIASEVFSNMVFHAFYDVGTTFYGSSIYDSPNVLNTTIIESRNRGIRIERRAFKNPLIFSTGFGLSSEVYGYNISVDYAFGYEDQRFQDPIWHIGLGLPL